MAEKLIPLYKDGQPVEMAMTASDFFRKKVMPKGDVRDAGELVTAADAGYSLGDRYEDLTEYDGPKTKRQHERAAEERRAERSAPRTEPVKADLPAHETPKAEAKKD